MEEEKTAPKKVFSRSCSIFICIKGIHCHLQRQTWGKENVPYWKHDIWFNLISPDSHSSSQKVALVTSHHAWCPQPTGIHCGLYKKLGFSWDGKTHTHILGVWLETSSISATEEPKNLGLGLHWREFLLLESTEQYWHSTSTSSCQTTFDQVPSQNFGEHKAEESNCKDLYHLTCSTTTKHFSEQYRKQINQVSVSLPVKKFIRIPLSSLMKPEGNENRGRIP